MSKKSKKDKFLLERFLSDIAPVSYIITCNFFCAGQYRNRQYIYSPKLGTDIFETYADIPPSFILAVIKNMELCCEITPKMEEDILGSLTYSVELKYLGF